jgi:CDP-glucose 4,6-dehydratase
VRELEEEILKHWPGKWVDQSDPHAVHEAHLLHLATEKAFHLLDWKPVWDFGQCVEQTVRWYLAVGKSPGLARQILLGQVSDYSADAGGKKLPWVVGTKGL